MATAMKIIQGARHRGRLLTNRDIKHAHDLLAYYGFGPYIQVWDAFTPLPADWPENNRTIGALPPRYVPPAYSTYFFETDRQTPVVGIPDKNPSQISSPDDPDWAFYDIEPFCWSSPLGDPPAGMPWCSGAQPPPWQGPPNPNDLPPEPLPADGTPPQAGSPKSSTGLIALGALLIAIPVAGVIILSAHRKSSS